MLDPKQEAEYIGDGVYVAFDGFHIWLYTERENGWHSIALELPVYVSLRKFAQSKGFEK